MNNTEATLYGNCGDTVKPGEKIYCPYGCGSIGCEIYEALRCN